MHRLFVAIRLPAAVRAQLLALQGGISGARWQTEPQLHLTIRFIGEVNRHVAEDVAAALGALHHPCFEVAVSGTGTFERRGGTATLWAGLAPEAPLLTLHKKVDQALVRIGLEPERRAYSPHITLARLPRGSGSVGPFLEQWGGVSTPPFTIDAFFLCESQLTPEGPVYSEAARYSLA